MDINLLATGIGIVAAIAQGFLWYGPLFGKAWAKGSHNITPPARLPVAALVIHSLAVVALGLVIGITATTDSLGTAVAAILAAAGFQLSGGLFSQKTMVAAMIDGGSILASGVVLIAAQGLL